jgi:hypothetical protein
MRYVEAQRFHNNPDWYDSDAGNILLPAGANLKVKVRQKQRWVRLNTLGNTIVPLYLNGKPLPAGDGWADNLKRWGEKCGLEPIGLCPKTTRKTWEVWLLKHYGFLQDIFMSQGHTKLVSKEHYATAIGGLSKQDEADIADYVMGWL